jgi:hypothetical protein
VLTRAQYYTPAVWLGLSQLHTLRDVDLHQVSMAAIAAGLPKLHTLYAFYFDDSSSPAAVAGFFTDLLPQLRVFHFSGEWPEDGADWPKDAGETAPPPPLPLPLLEELVWVQNDVHPAAFRGFLGAQPTVLSAPYELIVKCLPGRGGSTWPSSLLERVRELDVTQSAVAFEPPVSVVTRVLHVAPRLRTLRCSHDLCGDMRWLTKCAAPLGPAFADLVHFQLRCLKVTTVCETSSRDDGCVSRLRRTCFPRLREMKVNDTTFFATLG